MSPTDGGRHPHFGSVPDLKLLGAMTLAESPISQSVSISLQEEKLTDEVNT
jgi:hypothetical protein